MFSPAVAMICPAASGEATQHSSGGGGRVVAAVRDAQTRASSHQRRAIVTTQLSAQLFGGAPEDAVDLVDSGTTRFDGTPPGRTDQPNCFNESGAVLRDRCRYLAERGARRVNRVDRVRLAARSTYLPVLPRHFDHSDAAGLQMTLQTGPI
ncbi:hypothetical protein BJ991_000079 [Microbacterium immunditiarum]|uniref:Uncharacterized protein n=1 Tax=Microbacterium immunditiarum TaxID=337480 RepID=A0A7Y9KHZ1_9MICO|nr:hypothetical protein [Microbacterium immunditiarum]